MNLWYDRSGKPITMEEANDLLGNRDYKRVKLSRITSDKRPGEAWTVSTVWLGLDHSWQDGPPVIFETMVFAPAGDTWNEEMNRYTSEQDAIAGHDRMVTELCQVLTCAAVENLDEWPAEDQP